MQSTLDGLAGWLPRQPWYAGSPDAIPRLRELAEFFLPTGEPGVRARILLVRDDASEPSVLYQLPIVERDRLPASDPRVIGVGYGGVAIVDGPSDPAFAAALLGALRERGELRDLADDRAVIASEVLDDGPIAVLRIEPFGRPVLEARIARRVLDGPDPDAVAALALADADAPSGPRLVGVLPVEWSEGDGAHLAHLAVLHEGDGAERDGWTHLLGLARRDDDPTADARRLGATIARVHAALGALGSRRASGAETSAVIGSWRARLAGAAREVPALAERESRLAALQDAAASLAPWPELQTIHGALELGATRRAADGSWFLVGHGGGDARPADERADLPVRDVAGALRSLHYATAIAQATAAWEADARRALLDGYAEVAGDDALPAALLDALELDYAVLDAVWESRSRPAAVRIPLDAIDALVTGGLEEAEGAAA